jgi:hypothetical protein
MSKRARIRCAWMFANAPQPWGMMATLTFREQPEFPKAALKFFVRRFRIDHGDEWQWGWVMEWQDRGVIHFHTFYEQSFLHTMGFTTEEVTRHRQKTALVRGDAEEWFIDTWTRAVGDTSRKFSRFQRGGIVELLRSPDAAARYVAKEAGKRAQKQLPAGVSAAGRWWWLSPAGKPRAIGTRVLKSWPFEKCYSQVFDRKQLTNDKLRGGRPQIKWTNS